MTPMSSVWRGICVGVCVGVTNYNLGYIALLLKITYPKLGTYVRCQKSSLGAFLQELRGVFISPTPAIQNLKPSLAPACGVFSSVFV